MIVPMKDLTVLCACADRDAALIALRELGVLHLAPVRGPSGEDLDQARTRLAHLRRVLDLLPASSSVQPTGMAPDAVAERVWTLSLQIDDLEAEREGLERERARLAPVGTFEPAELQALEKAGIWLRLYHVAARERVIPPAGGWAKLLHENREGAIWIVVSRSADRLPYTEFRMPEQSLASIEARLAVLDRTLAGLRVEHAHFEGDRAPLLEQSGQLEEEIEFLEARAGMGEAQPICYLRGFAPVETVVQIRAQAARHCWVVRERDPEPGAAVPSLVRNPPWVRPIKTVLDFIGITPGYEEIDISAVFLLFLSLFFAMLVGDAGYGVIFLGLTVLGRRLWPRAPVAPFALMTIMSVATIAWGVVTGTYFGASRLPDVLTRLKWTWLADEQHLMLLCFIIGAVHLTIAHLWNAARVIRTPQALAQLGWIGTTWTMYFLARMMVLGETLPGYVMPVFWVSVAAIVLFMTPPRQMKTEWFNHVMLPLNLVSNFVDVVSYLRLFAVGTASFAVAAAFNDMALAGVDGWVSGLVAALILFFGHALNLLLSAMGVLVHGVRLNTLEFSSHIGMQWTGIPYRPFRRAGRGATV